MNLTDALNVMRDPSHPTADRAAAADTIAEALLHGTPPPLGLDAMTLLDECADLVEQVGAV